MRNDFWFRRQTGRYACRGADASVCIQDENDRVKKTRKHRSSRVIQNQPVTAAEKEREKSGAIVKDIRDAI